MCGILHVALILLERLALQGGEPAFAAFSQAANNPILPTKVLH